MDVQLTIDPAHLRQIALAAAKFSSRLLQHMPGFQADEPLIKEAMLGKKKGRDVLTLLSHASEKLRGDSAFMYWAVTTCCGHKPAGQVHINRRDILKLATPALLGDAEFVLKIMGYIGVDNANADTYDKFLKGVIAPSLLSNGAFMHEAAQRDVKITVHASRDLLASTLFVESVMWAVVNKDGVMRKFPPHAEPRVCNQARIVLHCASYALRWDPKLIEILPPPAREAYLVAANYCFRRACKRWQRAVRVLVAIQRMHKDVEARDARVREADLAEAMLTGGAVANSADAAENERYMGLMRMAWDMGRAAARAPRKRPREE